MRWIPPNCKLIQNSSISLFMLFYYHETWTNICIFSQPFFNIKTISPSMGIPTKKIRWSGDTMVFIMGILILVKQGLYIEMALSYITWLISHVLITRVCFLSLAWSKLRLWASCQIRKMAGEPAPGMPGTFSPSPQVSDPDMHHGTCVTHVPWCMPGSLTSGFLWNQRLGKTFPAFPAHA